MLLRLVFSCSGDYLCSAQSQCTDIFVNVSYKLVGLKWPTLAPCSLWGPETSHVMLFLQLAGPFQSTFHCGKSSTFRKALCDVKDLLADQSQQDEQTALGTPQQHGHSCWGCCCWYQSQTKLLEEIPHFILSPKGELYFKLLIIYIYNIGTMTPAGRWFQLQMLHLNKFHNVAT